MNSRKRFILTAIYFIILVAAIIYAGSDSPKNLKAEINDASVLLVWEAPAASEVQVYHIYRAETEQMNKSNETAQLYFKLLEKVTDTKYTDKDVKPDMKYVYYVVSVNNSGVESGGSNYVDVFTGKKTGM